MHHGGCGWGGGGVEGLFCVKCSALWVNTSCVFLVLFWPSTDNCSCFIKWSGKMYIVEKMALLVYV